MKTKQQIRKLQTVESVRAAGKYSVVNTRADALVEHTADEVDIK